MVLVDDSAKKVTKMKMSSMLVMANVLHAVPRVAPNCIIGGRVATGTVAERNVIEKKSPVVVSIFSDKGVEF